MKVKLYSLRDNKVGEFEMPFRMSSDAAAVRAFGDAIATDVEKKSLLAQHPEDFSLWYLGEFDTESGLFEQSAENLRSLAVGSDFGKEVK